MSAHEFDIEGAKIIFTTNFAGEQKQYNKKGERNFNIRIDNPDLIDDLRRDGWLVKDWTPKNSDEENPEPIYYIPVHISYPEEYPNLHPSIGIYNPARNRINWLSEEEIGMLDGHRFTNVDITIRPRIWHDDTTGEPHVKAFVKEMIVTLEQSAIRKKYADAEEGDD